MAKTDEAAAFHRLRSVIAGFNATLQESENFDEARIAMLTDTGNPAYSPSLLDFLTNIENEVNDACGPFMEPFESLYQDDENEE